MSGFVSLWQHLREAVTSPLVEIFEEKSNEVPLQRVLVLSCNEAGGGQSLFKPLFWPICQIVSKICFRSSTSIKKGLRNELGPPSKTKTNKKHLHWKITFKRSSSPDALLLADHPPPTSWIIWEVSPANHSSWLRWNACCLLRWERNSLLCSKKELSHPFQGHMWPGSPGIPKVHMVARESNFVTQKLPSVKQLLIEASRGRSWLEKPCKLIQ